MKNIKDKIKRALKDPYWFFERMYVKNRGMIKQYIPARYKQKLKKFEYTTYTVVNNMTQISLLKLRKYLPIKKRQGNHQFTVVTAVYNVSKYLPDFFESIVNQSLDFEKHIHIICVDDGSTDNSSEVIKNWQRKYPNNITYLYKENGGISSARNLGLQYVETEWVTFIDSDDFVHYDYFRVVDNALSKNNDIKLAVGNLRFYFEENKLVKDGHSLRYRFTQKEVNIIPIDNLDKNINLFVTVSFFKTKLLHDNKIIFDDKIKPNFEDGKFLADYFLCVETGNVAYLQKAIFFYRKRGDGSSTIDGSWQKKEKYYNILAYGYLPMLESYHSKYGYIPKNIQWTILYELSWHVKTILNNSAAIAFLSEEERKNYYDLCIKIFSYIDDKFILDFDLIGVWFLYKVGMLGAFKGKKPPFNIVYIENIDLDKKQILLVYPSYFDMLETFKINGMDTIPAYKKVVRHHFTEQTFVKEIRVWIPYAEDNDLLSCALDNQIARLSLFGRQMNQVRIRDIISKYQPSEKYITDGSWIIMDRDIQADDNAEHFYRYMMKNHPEQCCYFALNEDSHDWKRLEQEGFNLLKYKSSNFEMKLRKASKVISSHFDDYIYNYFGDHYENSKKFIFLQHGVIQNNLSRWLNYKRYLSLFVTSTPAEYKSIAGDNTSYQVGKKEVVLTGLSRHDALLKVSQSLAQDKMILIMPTWRASILGKASRVGNEREFNPDFMNTNYAQHWSSLINSPKLKDLASNYGYQIIFAPHANIEPYLPMFKVPEYISVWGAKNNQDGIQKLFSKAALMITDYSSVAFEMAFLKKMVLYYQFDKDEVFSGSHIVQQGYFSYEDDGFGPVAIAEEELLLNLEKCLQVDCVAIEPYKTRIENTFPFRDGKNCERIYQSIQALDKTDNKVDFRILKEGIDISYQYHAWNLLENRLNNIPYDFSEYDLITLEHMKFEALVGVKKFIEAEELLASTSWTQNEKIRSQAYIASNINHWDKAVVLWEQVSNLSIDEQLNLLKAYAKLDMGDKFYKLSASILTENLSPAQHSIIILLGYQSQSKWEDIISHVDVISSFSVVECIKYQPELIFAEAYRYLGMFDEAHNMLVQFEKHTNSLSGRVEIAKLAYVRSQFSKVIDQLESAFGKELFRMSDKILEQYITSLKEIDQNYRLGNYLKNNSELYGNYDGFMKLEIKNAFNIRKWHFILDKSKLLSPITQRELAYEIFTAYLKLGMLDEFKANYPKPTDKDTYQYWRLIEKFAILTDDPVLERECRKAMIILFDA